MQSFPFWCPFSLVVRKTHFHLRHPSQQISVWLLFRKKNILQSLKRRESLGRHSGYIQKVRHSVPGCSDRIDSTSVFVPGKTLLSIKQTVEQ